VCLAKLKSQLILLFSLVLLLFIAPLYFLILFMSFTVLFHLTFTFIYNTFSKKFSVSAISESQTDHKCHKMEDGEKASC